MLLRAKEGHEVMHVETTRARALERVSAFDNMDKASEVVPHYLRLADW